MRKLNFPFRLAVNRFLAGTREGRIDWQSTAKPEQFTASLKGKFSLLIDKDLEKADCWLTLVDADGRELHEIRSDDLYTVSELFQAARRQAMRVDQVIDDILGEI